MLDATSDVVPVMAYEPRQERGSIAMALWYPVAFVLACGACFVLLGWLAWDVCFSKPMEDCRLPNQRARSYEEELAMAKEERVSTTRPC